MYGKLEAMKKPTGCLGYIGDEKLPSYLGIISFTIIMVNWKDFPHNTLPETNIFAPENRPPQ